MITLQQIRTLEDKVNRAVAYIDELKRENAVLSDKLSLYEKRIEELEVLILEYKEDQKEIEQGILHALSQLDKLEDAVNPDAAQAGEIVEDIEGESIDADDQSAPQSKEAELDIF